MKIVMVSNYFNHHQKFFCDAMYEKIEGDFYFIATREMGEERKRLGYQMLDFPPYVVLSYTDELQKKYSQSLIDQADVVVFGSAPQDLLKGRMRERKIIFRYEERPLKKGNQWFQYIPRLIKWRKNNYPSNSIYMLCASAYTASDYAKFGLFKNRTYKWGYFPETYKYDISNLLSQKDHRLILWCGRFIDWKHPELIIDLAKQLKEEGYSFKIKLIGTGEMEEELSRRIEQFCLDEFVEIQKAMQPEQVRKTMEQAGIFLFTSDFQEGWGAVLNEAMNSGCATVASHAIGSVPFLMEHNKNGLIYQNGNFEDLNHKVKYLLDNVDVQTQFGEEAYNSITQLWSAEIAAERFYDLCLNIIDGNITPIHTNGPCSKAYKLRNEWFL